MLLLQFVVVSRISIIFSGYIKTKRDKQIIGPSTTIEDVEYQEKDIHGIQ